MDSQSVLILGSSNVEFPETDPTAAIPALVKSELERKLHGSEWSCEYRPLFYGERMAQIAERHYRARLPGVVVVEPYSMFARDVPIARIRRRWPRLYPLARRIAHLLKALAGGGNVHSPRGWLFRLPRWLMLRLVGGEPEVSVEDAIRMSSEAVDALVRLEEPLVIAGLAFRPAPRPGPAAEVYSQRIETFKHAFLEHCRNRRVDFYDLDAELALRGRVRGFAHDRDYPDLPTRRFEASLIADRILAGAGNGVAPGDGTA